MPETTVSSQRETMPGLGAGSEGNVLTLVHRLSSNIGRVFGRHLRAKHGVSVPEWRTVMLLAERPGCTAIDIATSYAMDKMAVTRAVQRLIRMGMVERQRRASDKRSFSLRLTAKGDEFYATLLPTSTARYREFVDALSRDERRQLRELLSRLILRAQELDS